MTAAVERVALLPCPFCGGEVMPRDALWPSDGDRDAIIHAEPQQCAMCDFTLDICDGGKSVAAAWNTRAMPDDTVARKFKLGDRVQKMKGSRWHGKIVGFYSTDLTPIGYAVESEFEHGSVQIYPENALDFHL